MTDRLTASFIITWTLKSSITVMQPHPQPKQIKNAKFSPNSQLFFSVAYLNSSRPITIRCLLTNGLSCPCPAFTRRTNERALPVNLELTMFLFHTCNKCSALFRASIVSLRGINNTSTLFKNS